MVTPAIYYEAISRANRITGAYLAMQAWFRGVEAVAVSRESLQDALAMKSLPLDRVSLFLRNNLRLFPHSRKATVGRARKIAAVVVSRVPLPTSLAGDTAHAIAKNLSSGGLKAVEVALPPEPDIVAWLAHLSHGFPVPTVRGSA